MSSEFYNRLIAPSFLLFLYYKVFRHSDDKA